MYKSASDDAKKNLKWLELQLKKAAKGRPASAKPGTDFDTGVGPKALQGAVPFAMMGSVGGALSTSRGIGSWWGKRRLNKKMETILEVALDETWKKQMTKIRKLGFNSPEATRAFMDLLSDVVESKTENPEEN